MDDYILVYHNTRNGKMWRSENTFIFDIALDTVRNIQSVHKDTGVTGLSVFASNRIYYLGLPTLEELTNEH